MPLYESPAVILRSMKLGEADRIITFFTRAYGKIKVVAKGVAKPKSRFMGRLEPFVHVNVIVFGKENADLYHLNACDTINPLLGIRSVFEKLNRAYVSAELVDICQKERDVNAAGFEALLSAWRMLAAENRPLRMDLLLRLFELKYLAGIGYMPRLDTCVNCGKKPYGASVGFYPQKSGVLCAGCRGLFPAAFGASMGAVKLMSKCLDMPMENVARLSAGVESVTEVERVVNCIIETNVRRTIKSEKFLKL